jgi:hypothetical protein
MIHDFKTKNGQYIINSLSKQTLANIRTFLVNTHNQLGYYY